MAGVRGHFPQPLNKEGKKKCEKGINGDMFLLGNISDGITGDYIF